MIRLLWLDQVIRFSVLILLPAAIVPGVLLADMLDSALPDRLLDMIFVTAAALGYAFLWTLLPLIYNEVRVSPFELALPIADHRLWLIRVVTHTVCSTLPIGVTVFTAMLCSRAALMPREEIYILFALAASMPLIVLLTYAYSPRSPKVSFGLPHLVLHLAAVAVAAALAGLALKTWVLYPLLALVMAALWFESLWHEVAKGIVLGTQHKGKPGSESTAPIFAERPRAAAEPTARQANGTPASGALQSSSLEEEDRAERASYQPAGSPAQLLRRYLKLSNFGYLQIIAYVSIALLMYSAAGESTLRLLFVVLFILWSLAGLGSGIEMIRRLGHLPVSRGYVLSLYLLPRIVMATVACAVGLGSAWLNNSGSIRPRIHLHSEPGLRSVEIPMSFWRLQLGPPPAESPAHLVVPIAGVTIALVDPVYIPLDASDEQLAQALHVALSLVRTESISPEVILERYLRSTIDDETLSDFELVEKIESDYDIRSRLVARSTTRSLFFITLCFSLTIVLALPLPLFRKVLKIARYSVYSIMVVFFVSDILTLSSGYAMMLGRAVQGVFLILWRTMYEAIPTTPAFSLLLSGAMVMSTYWVLVRLLAEVEIGVADRSGSHS